MRVEAGAVVDEFDLPSIGHVVARHTRTKTPDGGVTWACMFSVAAPGTTDLSVVHRLSAPTLAEGRRSVLHAVEFLAGRALTPLQAEPRQPGQPATSVHGHRPDGFRPARRATDVRPEAAPPANSHEFTPLVGATPRPPAFDLLSTRESAPPAAGPVDPVPAPLS
jgi:hypothetical protein